MYFSSTPRFRSEFISDQHTNLLSERLSPGPKYVPGLSICKPRSPRFGMGSPRQRKAKSPRRAIAPNTYEPSTKLVSPRIPQVGMARADRFLVGAAAGVLSKRHMESVQRGANEPGPGHYSAREDETMAKVTVPKFAAGEFDPSVKTSQTPRTMFITHHIGGGTAKPATTECGIGPADYQPNTNPVSPRLAHLPFSESTANRFHKPGIEFISHLHGFTTLGQHSPGPKYLPTVNNVNSRKSFRNEVDPGLSWI